jgi:hypothetical protein
MLIREKVKLNLCPLLHSFYINTAYNADTIAPNQAALVYPPEVTPGGFKTLFKPLMVNFALLNILEGRSV